VLLRTHGLMGDARFVHLAASCLAEVGEWEEVLTLLADSEPDDLTASQVCFGVGDGGAQGARDVPRQAAAGPAQRRARWPRR
jgi:hypothetical protein